MSICGKPALEIGVGPGPIEYVVDPFDTDLLLLGVRCSSIALYLLHNGDIFGDNSPNGELLALEMWVANIKPFLLLIEAATLLFNLVMDSFLLILWSKECELVEDGNGLYIRGAGPLTLYSSFVEVVVLLTDELGVKLVSDKVGV